MGRGLISGLIWGVVVWTIVFATASLLQEPPKTGAGVPQASQIEVPAGTEFDQARPERSLTLPQTEDTPRDRSASVPAGDTRINPPKADTTPAIPPATGTPRSQIATPDGNGTTPAVSGGDDVGLAQPGAGGGIAAPKNDSLPFGAATAPRPSPAGEPSRGGLDILIPQENAQAALLPATDGTPNFPAAPAAPATPNTEAAPETRSAPANTPKAETDPESDQIPKIAPQPEAQTQAPQAIRVPVPEITNLAPNVRTDRLPRIGGATPPESVEGKAVPAEAKTALESYAAPFENDDGKPMVAIVLVDVEGGLDPDTLKNMPFPVSFAIDSARADAAERAAFYRRAGFEVVLMTNLSRDARPVDVEVAFQSYLSVSPEVVAVMDGGGGGFQSSRELVKQVVAIIKEDGYGLLTFSKGLNAARQVAAREGVASALIFRSLDSEGESAPRIRRYLNRAAFRAAQEGHVVVVGQTTGQTLKGVLEWGLDERTSNVVIAPVSAVLLAQ